MCQQIEVTQNQNPKSSAHENEEVILNNNTFCSRSVGRVWVEIKYVFLKWVDMGCLGGDWVEIKYVFSNWVDMGCLGGDWVETSMCFQNGLTWGIWAGTGWR